MRLLADESAQLDAKILATVSSKAESERLEETDLDDCFALFAMVCNHVDELRIEVAGYSQSYEFDLDERRYSVVFLDGKCVSRAGATGISDVTMSMSTSTILSLLNGEVDAGVAHMNGEISCRGTKNGSVKLQSLFELFLDELGA